MKKSIDVKKEIIPYVGLGGIEIGDFLKDLEIDKGQIRIVNGQKMASIFKGAIIVLFSKNDKVIQLSAQEGYEGKLLNKYYVGQPVQDFMNDSAWIFSEEEDGFRHREISNLVVRLELEDATAKEVRELQGFLKVSEITIF